MRRILYRVYIRKLDRELCIEFVYLIYLKLIVCVLLL